MDIDLDLLARHLAGDGSAEDRRIVEQWISDAPGRRATIAGLTRGVLQNNIPRIDASAARARIAERTGVAADTSRPWQVPGTVYLGQHTHQETAQDARAAHTQPPRARMSRRSAIWYSVASVALSALALVVGWRGSELRMTSKLSSEMSVYTTQKGQRSAVTLPDGSTVLLSVASRLEVPADYSTGNRTLRLNGEAYFTVSHQQTAPFTVIAGASVTRVLGTQFLVRAYDSNKALIAVRDGKVAVGSRVLTAMEQIVVTPNHAGDVQRADASQFGIATGILAFPNTQLREAIPALNRWYDVDIRIGDPQLDARRITVELAAGSANDLIEVLEYSFNMRVVREGRVLTLYRR
jgi:ferric-dicitrate binding protein FerR (iron transport regulator)